MLSEQCSKGENFQEAINICYREQLKAREQVLWEDFLSSLKTGPLQVDSCGLVGAACADRALRDLGPNPSLAAQECRPTPSTGPAWYTRLYTNLVAWEMHTMQFQLENDDKVPTCTMLSGEKRVFFPSKQGKTFPGTLKSASSTQSTTKLKLGGNWFLITKKQLI